MLDANIKNVVESTNNSSTINSIEKHISWSDPDNELVQELKAKSEEGYNKLIKKYQKKTQDLAYLIIKDHEFAKDITQDVFFKIFNKISEFQHKSKFSSWLYRITLNQIYETKRKQKPHLNLDYIDSRNYSINNPHLPEKALLNQELGIIIKKAFSKLPENKKIVCKCSHIDGLSDEKIAEKLDKKYPTVKSSLHRGRIELRKNIGKYLEKGTIHETKYQR